MEYFYLFLAGAIAFAILIFIYDRKQSTVVHNMLKENKNVPRLLMLRSAEQKLTALKSAINRLDQQMDPTAGELCYVDQYVADLITEKQQIAQQVNQLVSGYHKGLITLPDYYAKLGGLLIKINKLKPELQQV
jgi:hypothetical protein